MSIINPSSFLKRCQISSQEAYSAFKELLLSLENTSTRSQALSMIHSLASELIQKHSTAEMLQTFHFSFSNLTLQQQDGKTTKLILLQLPSTFAPEEWSFTFFEGLSRYKSSEFQDRVVTELGCGIGWITLALAKQTKPSKIYGLDINPKAVLCSKINLFLNAFDHQGSPSWSHEGQDLTHFVEFHQSDLLEYCRNQKLFLDRIIGCIPQVLNPDPEFTTKVLAKRGLEQGAIEQDNDEFLYSLSNYTIDQGYLEDQFGLGLIARAVEESVEILRYSGKIILNLGGRPGTQVLTHLFQRRGFLVKQVWSTQVSQAKDTDIQGLVAIEQKTSHRFEFFMGQGSHTPVSAKTALAYAEASGEITHGLSVFEAQLRDPVQLPKILQFMRQKGFEHVRDSMDLSYPEEALAHEKISFLNSLIEKTQMGNSFFPYEETAGLKEFRQNISTFFQKYFRIPFSKECFLILPSRVTVCENILQTYCPKQALVDYQLARLLGVRSEVLEVPRNTDLFCELLEKLKPEIAIYSIPPSEAETQELFYRICEISESSSTRVFIDISELIELSSSPRSNGIFRYLSKKPLPSHVALICGLVKNRLYRDLEVCFIISQNQDFLSALENAAELTYSRTPVLNQLYYDRTFQDLINFQLTGNNSEAFRPSLHPSFESDEFKKHYIQFAGKTQQAFSHPAITGETAARAPHLIRLDYGENCLRSPRALQTALLESFAKIHLSPEEEDCSQETIAVIKSRFQLPQDTVFSVHLGNGVAPLFSKIAEYCSKNQTPIVFPTGSYGHFVASAHYFGGETFTVPTKAENQFKLTASELEKTLDLLKKPAFVILSAPLVNPTGAYYLAEELQALMGVVSQFHGTLILDSIFSGLEFSQNLTSPTNRPNLSLYPDLKWAIFGGISKEFAAGGLRVGYAITTSSELNVIFQTGPSILPHPTLRFALKRVHHDLVSGNKDLSQELLRQRQELTHRARRLTEVLEKTGWKVLPPQGGLFLSATPIHTQNIDTLSDRFRENVGVVINPPHWTGIPNYFRFVLSTTSSDFESALHRIAEKGKSVF
jgi:methionine S-methyltransferase